MISEKKYGPAWPRSSPSRAHRQGKNACAASMCGFEFRRVERPRIWINFYLYLLSCLKLCLSNTPAAASFVPLDKNEHVFSRLKQTTPGVFTAKQQNFVIGTSSLE